METKEKKKFNLNFDLLQKLGKVLMTVIAVMPAAGLMISIGKLVQMAGADLSIVMTIGTCTFCLQLQLVDPGRRNAQAVHLQR